MVFLPAADTLRTELFESLLWPQQNHLWFVVSPEANAKTCKAVCKNGPGHLTFQGKPHVNPIGCG